MDMGHFELQITQLVIGFEGQAVLTVPEFTLTRGMKLVLTGASGSGKSVFLQTLMGVLPAAAVWSGRFRLIQSGQGTALMTYDAYRQLPFIRQRTSTAWRK